MLYNVEWSKTYFVNGILEVSASSREEAEEQTRAILGDLVGSLEYDPEGDYVYATPSSTVTEELKSALSELKSLDERRGYIMNRITQLREG